MDHNHERFILDLMREAASQGVSPDHSEPLIRKAMAYATDKATNAMQDQQAREQQAKQQAKQGLFQQAQEALQRGDVGASIALKRRAAMA